MHSFSCAEISRIAGELGFNRAALEKVFRLKDLLDHIFSDDFLKGHLILKGGTAINLAVFNLPRLSFDIDLDYVPNDTREATLHNREEIQRMMAQHLAEEGYSKSPASRSSFALDSLICRYKNCAGNKDNIKIDINYSLRAHLLEPVYRPVLTPELNNGVRLHIEDPLEIFASKGNALLHRAAPRDLYDWCNMVDSGLFEKQEDLFRKCFIFYRALSAKNSAACTGIDTSAIGTITMNRVFRELLPVMKDRGRFDLEGKKRQAGEYISRVMRPTEREKEYLERFAAGEYAPHLLFDDEEILTRIMRHPMALWKCRPR